MKSKVLFGLLSVTSLLSASASQLPDPIIPAGVGVNIHFAKGHERDLDLIQAAGFKFVRMDFGWAGIERSKGIYDWSAYDELTTNLEERGLRAIYILDYSNPLYEQIVASKNPINGEEHRDTASPQHPESVEAFAKWAAAAVQHFHGRPIVWEIWNEPNISFWKPKPNAEQYTALALATCKAVRAAESEATIMGPATSGIPTDFLESFLKSGVLDYLNAVSVHPYRSYSKAPETAAQDYAKLRQMVQRYAPAGKGNVIPIVSGEWGYASHTKGVSLETQAAFIARQQLANLLEGVPLSIWYDWKNDGPDSAEREHNFGTVTVNLEPKPAYVAIQTLTRELAGYRIERRIEAANSQDYLLACTNPSGQQKLAAWTVGDAHTVKVRIAGNSDKAPTAIAGNGKPVELTLDAGQLVLPLGPAPVYIALGSARVEVQEP